MNLCCSTSAFPWILIISGLLIVVVQLVQDREDKFGTTISTVKSNQTAEEISRFFEGQNGKFVTLALSSCGGLCNVFFRFFSIYGIGRSIKRVPFINGHVRCFHQIMPELKNSLPNLHSAIRFMVGDLDCFQRPEHQKSVAFGLGCCKYDNVSRLKAFNRFDYLVVNGNLLQAYQYFHPYKTEIRHLMEFGNKVRTEVQRIAQQLFQDDTSHKFCVHQRTGDFKKHFLLESRLNFTNPAVSFVFEELVKTYKKVSIVLLGLDTEFIDSIAIPLKARSVYKPQNMTRYMDLHFGSTQCDSLLLTASGSTFGWWIGFRLNFTTISAFALVTFALILLIEKIRKGGQPFGEQVAGVKDEHRSHLDDRPVVFSRKTDRSKPLFLNETGKFITLSMPWCGGLCNMLYRFASLYGIARSTNRMPYIESRMDCVRKSMAGYAAAMPNLHSHIVFKKVKQPTKVNFASDWCQYDDPKKLETYSNATNVRISGSFLQSYKFFHPFKSDIRRLFEFGLGVRTLISDYTTALFRNDTSHKFCVHTRVGDFRDHFLLESQKNFTNSAIKFVYKQLKKTFPNISIVFIGADKDFNTQVRVSKKNKGFCKNTNDMDTFLPQWKRLRELKDGNLQLEKRWHVEIERAEKKRKE
ncbi:hypothetical protein M3Y95_00894500 [Aphelenchoides besseyi]|nr:hypothetical protein M3Y95_00894500 [Aphelenchoides besseyi]